MVGDGTRLGNVFFTQHAARLKTLSTSGERALRRVVWRSARPAYQERRERIVRGWKSTLPEVRWAV